VSRFQLLSDAQWSSIVDLLPDDDLRGQEAIVADDAFVVDLASAPDDHVIADLNERLQHVVFHDETVFPILVPGQPVVEVLT